MTKTSTSLTTTTSDLDQVKDAALKGALGNGTADNKQRYMELVIQVDEIQERRRREARWEEKNRIIDVRVEAGSAVTTGKKKLTHPDQITRATKKGGKKK